jgi:GlpG protein
MRQIGRLPEEVKARQLGDYLYAEGIENQVDPGPDGDWEIWVLDDTKRERAQTLFDEFRRHPDDPTMLEAGRVARRKRSEDREAQTPQRGRVIDGRTLFYSSPVGVGWLSLVLIVISVAVSVVTRLGDNRRLVQPLSITEYREQGDYLVWDGGLPEIRHGQVWRLFTPMFIHFGILHIFFNMLWLKDLGSMIEARKGWGTLLVLVLIIAAASNVAQYLGGGPTFGGMSGVVYGLFGYIWMQGRFNPSANLSLDPQTVMMMIVWFVLCMAHVIPNVANLAHGAGLAVGLAWGYVAAYLARRRLA